MSEDIKNTMNKVEIALNEGQLDTNVKSNIVYIENSGPGVFMFTMPKYNCIIHGKREQYQTIGFGSKLFCIECFSEFLARYITPVEVTY